MKQTTWTDIPRLALLSACQGAFFQTFFLEKEGICNMASHRLSKYYSHSITFSFHHCQEVFKNSKLSFAEELLAAKKRIGRLTSGSLPEIGFMKIYSQIKSITVLKLKNSPIGQTTALCDYLN